MATEIDGMKVTISADVSQAIKAIQDFHNRFKNIANSINSTVINANISMTDFNNSIGDIGSIANMAQMQKMQNSMKGINKSVTQTKNSMGMMNNPAAIKKMIETNKSLKEQGIQLAKNKKSWTAIGIASVAALVGIIKMSSLAQMWVSELGQIFTYFLDTALSPLSPIIYLLLEVFWKFTDWFSGLDPIIQGAVGALGLLGIAFGAITAFVAWLTGATGLSVITGAFSYIAGAIAGIAAIIGLPVEAVIVIIAAVGVALYLLWKNWDWVIASIGKLWDWLGTKISDILEGVKSYLSGAWDSIKNSVSNAWDYIKSTIVGAIQNAYGAILKIVDKIKDTILSVPGVKSAINIVQGAYQNASSYLGYAQGTEAVLATGLYKLHSGEKVIPKGESNTENNQSITFSPTINVNATIGSNVDIRNLANQLSNYWRDDLTRYTRGVT